MTVLHIDFETRSTVDLRLSGLDNYARHESTDVWCMAYSYPLLGDVTGLWTPSKPLHWLQITGTDVNMRTVQWSPLEHVREGGLVYAHNAAFELAIWNHIMVRRYGWPPLDPKQVRCTMAMAYAMALPGSLEKAAAAVGIQEQKDLAGGRLMLQMSRPRGLRCFLKDCACERYTPSGKPSVGCQQEKGYVWWDEPEKLAKLYDYCRQDVRVERQLETRLLPLSDAEQRLWQLDYAINQRGVYVDRAAVSKAIAIVEHESERLDKEMRRVTRNFVGFCTETKRLADWIRTQGVDLPGVAKADVLEALELGTLPDGVRAALLLRQQAGKSSTAKLRAMLTAASPDGRLRGMLQYHGAGTGRWAGRRVQLHNMPRPKLEQADIENAIGIITRTPDPAVAASWLDFRYGSPLDVISSCLRGMLCAAPGHDLMAADFSAIEARVLAWLAGEEKVLDVFRSHGRIYEHAAAGIYRKPMAEITKDERQVGKVAVLALGYGGGKGAFQVMAKGYGVEVGDDQAETIKLAWREAHPRIVDYWWELENAATDAVLYPGLTAVAGASGRPVKFKMKGSFLWCLLPSGRALCYPYPKMKPRETPWGQMKEQLHYMTVDGMTNKWVETHTYGGKLAENVTQAVARDLLAGAIERCDRVGFKVVLHVHDEVVVEEPETTHASVLAQFERVCSETPAWAEGLPIEAKGWRGRRYRK